MHAGRIALMSVDVVVVGAGPAGSAAARLLASWGHRVALLHRPPAASLAESIPPSCRKLFVACGLAEAIEAARFYRSTGNTVWWGSDAPRSERFADGLGYQVDRAVFDQVLRNEAAVAGAELREALVRAVEIDHEGARVQLAGDDVVRGRFVLDCSGRAGVVARRGWRTGVAAHPRTVALTSSWTSPSGWRGVEPTHTLVESYADGWAWSVPLSPEVRYVTAMIDPHRTDLARGRPASEVYLGELRKTRHLSSLLGGGVQHGPWGFDASVYTARTFASDPLLLVGDAASFVDPLSSYGIKKALASAWLAAVAVHTSLRTPGMTEAALALHAAREEAMAASLLRQSRLQFEDAESAHRHLFWTDRAIDVDSSGAGEPDVHALRDDPRVQRAFAWLKDQDTVALRPGATLRREPCPIVRGHAIVMEERLSSDAGTAGLRFLRDVDLIGVLTLAPDHDQVPAWFEAYNRRFPPVALPDFLGAVSVMVAFGLLEDSRASIG
jgi:flavin-dependent dehydrogenase